MSSPRQRISQRLFRHRAEDLLPHTVRHERVYIVPTRRGFAFFGTLLVMLVASINYQLNLGYALSFLLTGLFASSLLHTYLNLRGLSIDAIASTPVHAGDELQYRLSLSSSNRRERHGIIIRSRDGETRAMVSAEGNSEAILTIATVERGAHALGRLTFTSDYPLGLWVAWSYLHSPITTMVWPRAELGAPPAPLQHDGASQALARRADSGDLAGLRPWQPGDSPARVVWKQLARGRGLQVRLLEEDGASGDVELNLAATGLIDTEARLERLTAWLLESAHRGLNWRLSLPEQHLSSGDHHDAWRDALDALATHEAAATSTEAHAA